MASLRNVQNQKREEAYFETPGCGLDGDQLLLLKLASHAFFVKKAKMTRLHCFFKEMMTNSAFQRFSGEESCFWSVRSSNIFDI